MEKYTIDAKDKKLGRIATEAAHHLLGKDAVDFAKNKVVEVQVEVINVAQLDIDPKKKVQKTYTSYSGYPSGLKKEKLQDVISKKGYEEVVRKAVYGMLPGNKLRALRMKKLVIVK